MGQELGDGGRDGRESEEVKRDGGKQWLEERGVCVLVCVCTYIYIYIYIYVCVCVCGSRARVYVCVCVFECKCYYNIYRLLPAGFCPYRSACTEPQHVATSPTSCNN